MLLMMGGGAQMIDWQVRASRVVGSPGFEAVPGAELVIIDGMGHSLPRQLWPELATRIAELVHRAEAIRAAA